jgi:hypothetical protein
MGGACVWRRGDMNFLRVPLFKTFVVFGRDFRQLRKAASIASIHAQQGCVSPPI